MKLSLLVPFRPDGGHRDAAFVWTQRRIRRHFPGAQVIVGTHGGGPFNRSAALNRAAERATGEVLVIADADAVFGPADVARGLRALRDRAWCVPFDRCLKLTSAATARLLAGSELGAPPVAPSEIEEEIPSPVGMLCIVPRETYWAAGGCDERFVGWGGADNAMALALDAIAGSHRRYPGIVWHLWHPSRQPPRGDPLYVANWALVERYRAAARDPAAMAELVAEEGRRDERVA